MTAPATGGHDDASAQIFAVFDELPETAKNSLRYRTGLLTPLEAELHERQSRHTYLLEMVPVEQMKARIMSDPELNTIHADYDAFHTAYGNDGVTAHVSRWPVIADDVHGQVIDDGWHRLHHYIDASDTHIPVLHVVAGRRPASPVQTR